MTDRYTHFEKSFEEQAVRNNKPSFGFSLKPGPVLVTKAGSIHRTMLPIVSLTSQSLDADISF